MNYKTNTGPSKPNIQRKSKMQDSCLPYAELSEFDDVLTQVLLDGLYLGFTTHKFNDNLLLLSEISETNENNMPLESSESVANKQICRSIELNEKNRMDTDVDALFQHVSLVDAMALVITFLVKKYILRNKDLDGAAGRLLEFFMNPQLVYSCSDDQDKDEYCLLSKACHLFEHFGNLCKNFDEKRQNLFKEYVFYSFMISNI